MSPIPAHCPCRAGDRVQLHGFPGCPPGSQRTGFRGVVRAYHGGTILSGATDDGGPWVEEWGALHPEGHDVAKVTDGYRCTCCAPPGPKPARDERGRFLRSEQPAMRR